MFDLSRPRRSVLYMPGSNQRALQKASELAADALILDLEDAVAPGEKLTARALVEETLAARPYGKREVAIRINGLDTEWGMEDLKMACRVGPDAILIPKVQSAPMVEEIERFMLEWDAPNHTYIWAMIETPLGVLHAEQIATSTPRLGCFVIGPNDLVKELGAEQTEDRTPLIAALGQCVLAAKAYGVAIIDGVYNEFRNEAGFRARCLQSRQMGFDGITLIHPNQIAPSNDAFRPSAKAIDLAKRHIQAFDDATAKGEGVAVVDGRIVENLHVAAAQKLLASANTIRALEAGLTQE